MRGTVTGLDVLTNFRTIWVEFGPSVAFSCIGAVLKRKPTTFLDVALKDAVLSPAPKHRRPRSGSFGKVRVGRS